MDDKARETFRTRLLGMLEHNQQRLDHLEQWGSGLASQDDMGELSSYDQHTADAGTETYERTRDLGLREEAIQEGEEIRAAIERLEEGSFGLCERCGRPIASERLEALPTARRCMPCAQEAEEQRVLASAPKLRPDPRASLREGWRSPAFARKPHASQEIDDEGREEVWDSLGLYPNANSPQDDPDLEHLE